MLWWILGCTGTTTPTLVSGDDTAVSTEGALSVLTYNVQGLPDELTDAEMSTADRMVRIAPLLQDYDLVGLQESFDDDHHAALIAEGDHGTKVWFDALVEPGRVYGAGLGILARPGVPRAYHEEHYTQCNGVFDGSSDCLASKGFQAQTLALGGVEIDVLNTHHEAGGGPDDVAARTSQVEQVLAWLDTRGPDRAVLVMGDFNLRWTDPADVADLQRYADAGLRNACDEVGCSEVHHIDQVLIRDADGLELEVTAWQRPEHFVDEVGADLSDHPAISVDVAWRVPVGTR